MQKKINKIPGLLSKLLDLVTAEPDRIHLNGDYEEIYDMIYRNNGRIRAHLWILKQILISITILISDFISWNGMMYKNYLKTTLRNIKRNKIYSFINMSGLAAYTVEQKTKEIGIRKVLGASVINIFFFISKEFTKLVAIALIFAVPVSYYIMNNWLQNFAYRIDITAFIFIISGTLTLLIALLTVCTCISLFAQEGEDIIIGKTISIKSTILNEVEELLKK